VKCGTERGGEGDLRCALTSDRDGWRWRESVGIEEDGGSLHPAASGFHGRSSPVRLPVTRLVGGRAVR
jgi:hypothetical protein